jgi:hypothetical protein
MRRKRVCGPNHEAGATSRFVLGEAPVSEHDANRALTDTARLRALPDPLEQTQRMEVAERREAASRGRALWRDQGEACTLELRERRKAATVGARAPETHRLDAVSERAQQAVEAGVWPSYAP